MYLVVRNKCQRKTYFELLLGVLKFFFIFSRSLGFFSGFTCVCQPFFKAFLLTQKTLLMYYPVLFFLISSAARFAFQSVAQVKIDFRVSSLTGCLKETRQCSR